MVGSWSKVPSLLHQVNFLQEKNSVAQKKYDYVFAPPLLPGLLAAAPMAIATQHSTAPEKYQGEKTINTKT